MQPTEHAARAKREGRAAGMIDYDNVREERSDYRQHRQARHGNACWGGGDRALMRCRACKPCGWEDRALVRGSEGGRLSNPCDGLEVLVGLARAASRLWGPHRPLSLCLA